MAQVGVEPTASLCLKQRGLPVAYRADCFISTQSRSRTCKHSGLSRAALPVGVSGPAVGGLSFNVVISNQMSIRFRFLQPQAQTGCAGVVPDGLEPSLPACKAGVVAAGPRDCFFKVDSPGVAPRFPTCDAGVFLLDDEPMLFVAKRKPWDSNPQRYDPHLFSRQAPHPAG